MNHEDLWFTSSTSVSMMGNNRTASYSGLYKCSLDTESGRCEIPEAIATGWYRDGRWHHQMPLMNVQLDVSNSHIYARTCDKKRDSWEIIRAPLDTLEFESYFRTYSTFEWNECQWKCCNDTGPSYVQVIPKSFLVDDGDVFVAWDGFFKDCSDPYSLSKGLTWTIGVSRIRTDKGSCILNGGSQDQNFASCTEPVSIVYQNTTGRSRVLPFGGFVLTRAPETRQRMFFMTVLHSEGIDTGKTSSEIWISPEGARYSTSPSELQTIAPVEIFSNFFDEEIEDGGSIRLHIGVDGKVDHLCRTIFDSGVSCFPLAMGDAGRITVDLPKTDRKFVTREQLKDTCHFELFRNKPYNNRVFTVATGLEVLWGPTGEPQKIFFGCFGSSGGNGNFTTVDRDGNLTSTLPGAYPGSILFGVNLPVSNGHNQDNQDKQDKQEPWSITSELLLMGLILSALFVAVRRLSRYKRFVRIRGGQIYVIDDNHDGTSTRTVSGVSDNFPAAYFELSNVDHMDDYTEGDTAIPC